MFEWNAVLARWNWIKFQDLIWLPKNLMNLSFSLNVLAEVSNSPTLGALVNTKTKCIKLIFIGKIALVPVAFFMALSIEHVTTSNIPFLSRLPRECMSRYFKKLFSCMQGHYQYSQKCILKKNAISCCEEWYCCES